MFIHEKASLNDIYFWTNFKYWFWYRRFSEWKTLASKQDNGTKLNKVYKERINSINLDVDRK